MDVFQTPEKNPIQGEGRPSPWIAGGIAGVYYGKENIGEELSSPQYKTR